MYCKYSTPHFFLYVGISLMSRCHFVIVTFRLRPSFRVCLHHPAVAVPARDNLDDGVSRHVGGLQRSRVIGRKRGRQLVEDAVVGTLALTFLLGIYILILQGHAKHLDLLVQTIGSHHRGKLHASVALLHASRQQMEDDPTAETDDGSNP